MTEKHHLFGYYFIIPKKHSYNIQKLNKNISTIFIVNIKTIGIGQKETDMISIKTYKRYRTLI